MYYTLVTWKVINEQLFLRAAAPSSLDRLLSDVSVSQE